MMIVGSKPRGLVVHETMVSYPQLPPNRSKQRNGYKFMPPAIEHTPTSNKVAVINDRSYLSDGNAHGIYNNAHGVSKT